jgi:hypothetical protein
MAIGADEFALVYLSLKVLNGESRACHISDVASFAIYNVVKLHDVRWIRDAAIRTRVRALNAINVSLITPSD